MNTQLSNSQQLLHRIFNADDCTALALDIFRYQAAENLVYRLWLNTLGINANEVAGLSDIPFLPIELFKNHQLISKGLQSAKVFESSGTTGSINSKHFVHDLGLCEQSILRGFKLVYGEPKDWVILALLPSYLERDNASLVYMADYLIKQTQNEASGFYLDQYADLSQQLQQLKQGNKKIMLIGVTFALLDLAEQYPQDLSHVTIMETGGMKGRRKELTREELHSMLTTAFNVQYIHSEYGMTELLSQAYSKGEGIFNSPPWMKVLVRDPYDPMQISSAGSGALCVVDLANLYSCSFIATGDLGRVYADGSFEVLGRMDISDIRGCNLMVP